MEAKRDCRLVPVLIVSLNLSLTSGCTSLNKGLIAVAKMYVRNEHKAKLCLDNNLTELGKFLFKRGV